jgi:hypothetical protein
MSRPVAVTLHQGRATHIYTISTYPNGVSKGKCFMTISYRIAFPLMRKKQRQSTSPEIGVHMDSSLLQAPNRHPGQCCPLRLGTRESLQLAMDTFSVSLKARLTRPEEERFLSSFSSSTPCSTLPSAPLYRAAVFPLSPTPSTSTMKNSSFFLRLYAWSATAAVR